MAEGRRYCLNPQLDIPQILQEAQNRWLRSSEVCEILRNYQNFYLTPDPPFKPPGGSLFLFDRKALRCFRKDGHYWRKKKDGKTVREAHEKLKAGSVDVLHCYYAHGEDNENFQRRSYWMLDGKLEHIVLVHYREVKEGNRSAISHLLNAESGTQNPTRNTRTSSPPSSVQANSPALAAQATYASSPSTADWNVQTPSSEFEDVDSGDDVGASPLGEAISGLGFRISSLQATDTTGSSISQSNPRGLAESTGINNGLSNPFYANQVFTGKFVTDNGTSQQAGWSELPKKHLGVESFGGASFGHEASSSLWSEIHVSNRILTGSCDSKLSFNQTNGMEDMTRILSAPTLDTSTLVKGRQDGGYRAFPDAHLQTLMRDTQRLVQEEQCQENIEPVNYSLLNKRIVDANHYQDSYEHHSLLMASRSQNRCDSLMDLTTNEQYLGIETEDSQTLKNTLVGNSCNDEQLELKKLDSFGRWMNKEIGRDCDDSLMASDSGNYWNSLNSQSGDKEVSSLLRHMQLDVNSLEPSLSQEQLFSILDFSPDWAYSEVDTKILISGTFLGGIQHPRNTKWCCMFGEIEASAEVLTTNVLCCQAPAHAPGRVPFYITCGNRLSCSEVRDFEFRQSPSGVTFSISMKSEPKDELMLQIRLVKMLFLGDRRKQFDCFVFKCEKCRLKNDISSLISNDENEWGEIKKASKALPGNCENPRELLVKKLLKERLYEWLLWKAHEEGKGPNILDDEGLGAIHLAAALGYEWAMSPIVAAGVSPSFRDAHGRTGLHWAAYFGREETVVSLVRLGAAAGALEDPTTQFREGRTAADLASSRGHKGIAGYLAEADLTSHLSLLTLKESIMGSVSANLAVEKAIETVEEQSIIPLNGEREGTLSLKESLAAVRNSAQAAARIQAAFRIHSFQQRQLTESCDENFEIPDALLTLGSVNSKGQKMGHFTDYLHAAAVRIQQKYHGWKGRKEFLKIRNRIVKIQAHVRGHQVRKQYKKVIWSVSIVEKVILRWRRKGAGLRGFRADTATRKKETEVGKTDGYEFLRHGRKQKVAAIEKALSRVQSMVRYPEARDQYVRLVTNFQKSKIANDGATSGQLRISEESKVEDLLAPMTEL